MNTITDLPTSRVKSMLALEIFQSKNTLKVVFTICFISTLFSGIVTMLMSVYLPVAVKDLLGNVSGDQLNLVSAYINSFFIFGWMTGGFIWGFICDNLGRSKAVALSTGCYGLFALLTSFAPSWPLVTACRFLTGFGIGGVMVATSILIAEIWPANKRAVAIGMVSVGIPIGFFIAGIINNMLVGWHQAFLLGILPLALAATSLFVLKEPEKWVESKSKAKQRYLKELFQGESRKNLVSGSLIFASMLIGLWAIFLWAPTWVQNLTIVNGQQQRGFTIMIMAGGGLAGSFFSGWIENALGLRKTMMMCFGVCFGLVFVVFKLSNAVSTTTFVELGVLAFFFGISQGALAVYIPLLFPAHIRGSATGFCFNIGRLFTGTVVFFIGMLESMLGSYGNAIFIFSFIFVIGFMATFFSKDISVKKNEMIADAESVR